MTQKTLFSFGHGYSAQTLEPALLKSGWRIFGTTRSAEKKQVFESRGVTGINLETESVSAQLLESSHLLVSAGPGTEGDPLLQNYAEDLLAAAANITKIVYLSTTGVYGDHGGDWVDETTALTPATKRGVARVEAEQTWQEFATDQDIPLVILRLAGIYGPGRGPFSKLRAGTARRIIKEGQVFSRIHVDDIAQTIASVLNRPESSGIYNVCDDDPAPPQDVLGYAAELLNLPIPPEEDFETAQMTPMARSFYAESKKVRNDKMKQELGITLNYPDYKSGLRSLLSDSTD